jgi:protein-disulfide isomerase
MRRFLGLCAVAVLAFTSGASAQQARKPVKPNWAATVAVTPQGGYRQGNPNAVVKLIEYGSRTCPSCGRFAAEGVEPLRREYIASGKVSYEYRDFLIHGAPDFALALLNQCVGTNRFFPVLDTIYAKQGVFAERLEGLERSQPAQLAAWQKLAPAEAATRFAEGLGMIAFMKTQGLPEASARACLRNPALIRRVTKTNADAANIEGIDSTPSFIVNGRRVSAFSWDRLLPELWANGA